MTFWRTTAAIFLKRLKIEEKLLWRAYRNSPTLFRTVPSPTPYALPFLEIGGLQLSYPLLSQEQVKLYGLQIRRVHLHVQGQSDESPSNVLKKRERGRIHGLTEFFCVPPIISGTGKATTSNCVGTFIASIGKKSMKNVGNSSRGPSQGVPKILRASMYRAHCAVIFEIAQLSC